jgi:hypothetical protein
MSDAPPPPRSLSFWALLFVSFFWIRRASFAFYLRIPRLLPPPFPTALSKLSISVVSRFFSHHVSASSGGIYGNEGLLLLAPAAVVIATLAGPITAPYSIPQSPNKLPQLLPFFLLCLSG